MRVKSRISASQLRLAFCALAGSLMSFVLLATYSPYIVRNSTVGTVFTSSGTATSGSIFSGARVRNFRDTRPVRLLGPASHKDLETVLASGAPVNCRLWAVVTTIFTPSEAVKRTAGLLPGWCMVVVADRKGPKGYAIDEAPANIFYLTTAYQEKWAALSPFVDSLPWNHFGRKNVGYLWAITHGAQQVWDFDDDNELVGDGIVFPNDSTRIFSLPNFAAEALNPYPIMGAPTAWPRGFPLEQIKNGSTIPTSDEGLLGSWDAQKIGVIQSLANHDPDVDAIYRLTRPLPLYFERPSPNEILLIPRNTLTPYNAQATLHLHSALWALLLPITVHGRVSDIWRGYAMQRLLWDAGLHVAFSGPWVRQERNPHSWLADLQAETDLFAKSGKLVEFLQSWKGTGETLPERIEQLFIELYERSYIELDDVHLAQRWVAELAFAGYIFPPIVRKLTLAVRTFGGDIGRLNDGLLPTMEMFVDRAAIEVKLVFDDENERDHNVGDCLSASYSIGYEGLPANHEMMFTGKAWGGVRNPGYDRQQWATFHLDRFTDSDYIGVIDSDGSLFSFLHPESGVFDADGRVICKSTAKRTGLWPGDAGALHMDEEALGDFMYPNRMPIWYRRETFQNARNYIATIWNMTFDQAFAEIATKRYSQFNIMTNYALKYESRYYKLVKGDDPVGAVSIGCNGGFCTTKDIQVGCCRTFGVACTDAITNDHEHMLRWFETEDEPPVAFLNNHGIVDTYYEQVHEYIRALPNETVGHMRDHCMEHLAGRSTRKCET